jgi:outer membrane receptor protein involved in Fe transport
MKYLLLLLIANPLFAQTDTIRLKEINVRSTKLLIRQKSDRIIINVENSITASGNNVMELIRMAPLVRINQNDKITLKGKENVLIMLDGKALPGETLMAVLQNLSAEQVARIELITNPSAKYDAAASGGIINIITKKETGIGLNGTINGGISQSNYTRYNTGLAMNYRTKNVNIYGNLYYRKNRSTKNETLIRQTMSSSSILFGRSTAETGKIGIDYNPDKTSTIGFAMDGVFSQVNNQLNATAKFPDSTRPSTSRPKHNISFTSYNLNYKKTFDTTGRELLINLTHSGYNGKLVTKISPPENRYTTSSLFNITTFQADYSQPQIELGIKESYTSSDNKLSSDTTTATHYRENIIAAYFNLSKQLKQVKIQLGLRTEQTNTSLYSTNSYIGFFPSALIEKKFSENYLLALTYARKINRPDYESLIPFVIPIDRYTEEKGNPGLKPEYSNTFELTSTLKQLSLTLGYTHTSKAITEYVLQNQLTNVWSFTRTNFDKMENFSLAINIPLTITKWWSANTAIFGMHASYSDKSISTQSAYSYNINTTNSFSLSNRLNAELTGTYNSANVFGIYHISDNYQVNAGISQTFLKKKVKVKLSVSDIFHSTGYKLYTDVSTFHFNGSNYTDSRRISLSCSYKFGGKIPPAPDKSNGSENEKSRLGL